MIRVAGNLSCAAIVAVLFIAGCDSASEKDCRTVRAGTEVSLLEEHGEYVLVRVDGFDGSSEVYVPRTRLRLKNTLSEGQGGHSHVLMADVEAIVDPPPTEPAARETRSREAIEREMRQLNRLYLTEKSQIRVIASLADISGEHPLPIHEPTGELCWPAFECRAPHCPGRSTSGENHLFINSKPGTRNWCPECLKMRNVNTESPDEQIQYARWVRIHDFPDSAKRRRELAAEMQRALQKDRSVEQQ